MTNVKELVMDLVEEGLLGEVSKTRLPYTYAYDYLCSDNLSFGALSRSEMAEATSGISDEYKWALAGLYLLENLSGVDVLYMDESECNRLKKLHHLGLAAYGVVITELN